VCDSTKLIAGVYCAFDRSHVQGWSTALVLIGGSEEAIELVSERAATAFTPLVLAAWLDLPDKVEALRERAAGVVKRSLTGSLAGDEILRQNDRGYLARWASPEHQEAVAVELVGVLANRDEIDLHRFEAGEGLTALAPRLGKGPACELLDRLLEVAEAVGEGSRTVGLRSHQNVHFARVLLNAPSAGAEVRAVALRAASELGARCDRLGELAASVGAALADLESALRVAAIGIERAHPGVTEIDLARLLEDEDPSVRCAAFATYVERGEITGEDPRVMAMCEPGEVFASRCAVLMAARGAPGSYEEALERLQDDPNIYLRTSARRVLGEK
jgi:HEAT repeat protein